MSEMSPIGMVGFGALGVLVLLWLVISFSAPSPRRTALEWLAATTLYVSLSMLFLNLVLRARAGDSTVGLVAFGFLLVVFGSGFFVSLYNTLRALGGGQQAAATQATN